MVGRAIHRRVAFTVRSFVFHFRKRSVGTVHADRRLPAAPAADPRPQWALPVLCHRSSIACGRTRRLLHHLHDLTVLGAHSPQVQWTLLSLRYLLFIGSMVSHARHTQWYVVSVPSACLGAASAQGVP